MQHPAEDGHNLKIETETSKANARNSLLTSVGSWKRMDNLSHRQNNSLNCGFAKNMLISGGIDLPEEKEITFPKARGIKKKLVNTRAIKMNVSPETLWSGEDFDHIRSSQSKDGNHIIRATANCSVHPRERSQSSGPDFHSGLEKTRSAVLKLRDSRTLATSGDGVFSSSKTFTPPHCSQSEVPESQEVKDILSASTVLTEVFTSKFEVFPEQQKNSQSVMGPFLLALSFCLAERLEHRGGRVSSASQGDSLTACSKPGLTGAVGDRGVNEAKKQNGARNRTCCGRRKTVKNLRIFKRGVVMMAAMKKEEEEEEKMKRITIKSGRKCRWFIDATLNENWNERKTKQGRKQKRKGEGIRSHEAKRWGKAFAKKKRRGSRNESELQLKATKSRDPKGREVTFIIIISGCHQQKQYQQSHKKCRKQPTTPKLTLLLLLILLLLLFAAGRWFQPRKAWKRLLQLKGFFNVKSTSSCLHVLTYPYRQLRICFFTLSLVTVFILLLLKLSSLLLLIALVSLRHQYLLKYKAENYPHTKKHYDSCFMRLHSRHGFCNCRRCVSYRKFCFNSISWTISASFFMNIVQKTKKGLCFSVTHFQRLRPREHLLFYSEIFPRIYFYQKDYPKKNNNCDNNNNRENNTGHNYYYDQLSRVAYNSKHPHDETSCPPIKPNSKLRESEGKDKVNNNNYYNKSKTFPFASVSINVTTCLVRGACNTHPRSHRRDKCYHQVFSLFYAEKSLPPKQSYLHPDDQLPKCYVRLSNNSYKTNIRAMTDSIILRIGGLTSRFKYKKEVASYDYDNKVNENIEVYSSLFTPFFPELPRQENSVVNGKEDDLYGLVPFPYKDTGQLTNIRLLDDDNCFRPGLDVECDTKHLETELALYEQANASGGSQYYNERQKTNPPGNKISHLQVNQKVKREEEEERETKKRKCIIVLLSQQTRNWWNWTTEEIGTPVGTEKERLNSEKTSRLPLATTRLVNTELRKGMTITTTYEREMKSLNNCIGACGLIQSGRRRRQVIASSWQKRSSSRGGGSSSSGGVERKPSTGRGKLAGVHLAPHLVVPAFRVSKDNQATVDAKNGSFEHTGNLSTTTPSEWTLSNRQGRLSMETTSPGILTQLQFFTGRIQLTDSDHFIRDSDNVHIIPHNSTTYNNNNNNNPNAPLIASNDDANIISGFNNSSSTRNGISHNNGLLQSLATRRHSESHQSKPSSKPHERISSEYTSFPSKALSQQFPSCSNSRSSRHDPRSCSLPTFSLHHHHHNHHQKQQQQQHSPYQHNNKNNINVSYYYDYFCDYFTTLARRFSAKGLGRILPNWGKTFLSLLLVFQLVGPSMFTSAVPVPKKKLSNEVKGMNYLTNFGYVSGPSQEAGNLMSESVKIESIKRFQIYADLPVTGIFDHRTMEMMEKPRCGNSDKPALMTDSDTGRTKRYILSESRWGRTNLTFRFLNYTPDINFPKIRKAIYDAFLVWSRVTHLTFTEIMFDSNNDADVRIQFAQRYHNDGYPFDGEGIILAHAFFPGENKGGDTHFDDDEHWTVDSEDGVNLFMVAAHEFGHALGLSHSKTPGSLMYPWYQGKKSKGYQLPQDDVDGIQKLYGVKNGNETIDILVKEFPDDTYDTKDDKDEEIPHGNCTHTFDAITKIRGDVYIFKGKYFWRWTSGGLKDSKPIPISHFWYQFPEESIDAVFERKRDSKIMFFKGDKYWLYNANHMDRGWPLEGRPLVELGLPGDLKKIDAAFTWSFNKRTYLVSNDMYWKFDEMESYMVYDYPRAMKIWEGVPTPLDAAFQFTDNKTYFIKGKYYWEYEDQKMRVKNRTPTGNIAERWMQCPSEQKAVPYGSIGSRDQKPPKSAGCRQMAKVSGLLLWSVGYFTRRLMA